jgi:hypothetical protein
MEKGLKWLLGGLIVATVLMFTLVVSSVKADAGSDGYCHWYTGNGQHMYYMHDGTPIYPPSVLTPQVDKNTSSSQNYINRSVNRDNMYRPNVTVNTPKPQR